MRRIHVFGARPLIRAIAMFVPLAILMAVALLAGCVSARSEFSLPNVVDPSRQPAATNVYEEVLASLDKADAYVRVKLEEGDVALDKSGRLHLDKGTEAGVWLNIEGGTVASARIEFTRRVRLEATPGVPMSFRELRVTSNGEVEPTDLEFEHPVHRVLLSGELPKIRQLVAQRVRISTDLYAMFVEGKVFAPATPTAQATQAWEPPSPMPGGGPTGMFNQAIAFAPRMDFDAASAPMELAVLSVSGDGHSALGSSDAVIAPSHETGPALGLADRVLEVSARINEATLRQGSVLLLNDYDHRSAVHRTRVVIGPGSSVAIPYARVIPREKSVKVAIDLSLTTLDSAIVTANRRFDFASGSKLIARKLAFEKTGTAWTFRTESGSGYAELALKGGDFAIEGSRLTLAPAGSSIVLFSLDLGGSSSPGQSLTFGGAGRITLKVDGGSLHFNTLPGGVERAYLALDSGSQVVAEGNLKPVQWGTGAAWQVSEGKARIDLNVNDGVFDLGPGGVVLCGPGTRLESAAIDFDTSKDRNFTGTLDHLRVQDIRATLKGQSLASRLKLDHDSFLLLGDGSSLQLRNAVLDTKSSSLRASVSANLFAIGGTLDLGESHFVLADHGSRAIFNNVQLDTNAKRFVYGTLDRISCVVQGTRICSGKYIRDLSLAAGSTAVLSPLDIDRDTGRITGKLLIDAQATDGGILALGPGASAFPFRTGTFFRASDLTVDSNADAPVHGKVQSASITTDGGHIDLAAASGEKGGSGFVGVAGKVSFQDVSFPLTADGVQGRAFFGEDSSSSSVTFTSGSWDMGAASFRLRQGSVRGPLVWEKKDGALAFQFRPTLIQAETAGTISPINEKIGDDPKKVPCVLSTGVLSLSGGGSRFSLRSEASFVEGSFAAPFIRHAEGLISIECLESVSLDVLFDGKIYIPCDGDAEEGGAKTYPERLALGVTIAPGWRLAGLLGYNADKPTSIELSEVTGNPILITLLNKTIDDKDKSETTTIVDHREMNDDFFGNDHCDRVTVRWRKGTAWKARLADLRLSLSSHKAILSADLQLPQLKANEGGLTWDGSGRVEWADDWGLKDIDAKVNGGLSETVSSIKAKVSRLEYSFEP